MSLKNATMTVSRFGGQTAFELSSPPMIGLLPATTVVYILLGMGALLPILLLSIVAVTLCVRRRSWKSSSAVIPVDVAITGCHNNSFDFDVDINDIGDDDVFEGKKWKGRHVWNPERTKWRVADNRKRIAAIGGKMEVHSVDNPNVYFRNASLPTLDVDAAVPPSPDVVQPNSGEPSTPPPSCDVTLTSSSRSDVGGDTMSMGLTSGGVLASTGSTLDSQRIATLDRVQSMTRSFLQQEEEKVLK